MNGISLLINTLITHSVFGQVLSYYVYFENTECISSLGDDRNASHHSLHAKRWHWTDHLYASPPPTGKLQNDTFLKAQLSKVLGQITSLLGGHFSLGCTSEDALKILTQQKSVFYQILVHLAFSSGVERVIPLVLTG